MRADVGIPASVETVISQFLAELHLDTDSRDRLMAVMRNNDKWARTRERQRIGAMLERILISNVVWPQETADAIYALLNELKAP